MKQVNLPEDLESANDKFFTHPVVEWFLNNAGTQVATPWECLCLGDTTKERYEALYTKFVEITNIILSKGGKGYFWIICNPKIWNIIDGATPNYVPSHFEQFPLGYDLVQYMGTLAKRWRIYTDSLMAPNTILFGAGFSKKHANYYCKLTLEGF
jgi:hypothetical protein